MSRTLDSIWRSDRNFIEKLARTAYAGVGKVIQPFNNDTATIMFKQANPDIDQNKDGQYGLTGGLGVRTDQTLTPTIQTPSNDDAPFQPQSANTNSAYNAWAAQQAAQARNGAKNLAIINENLRLMPNDLRRIDEAEKNKYAHIEDDYNRANGGLDNYWKQVQEDYNTARTQRLGNRRRQIGVADDDFKKQRDAYARYFARSGSGSSSTAQYAVPALLARAADKVRSSIEDNNEKNAREQETNYNRQGLDYRKQKDDILTNRERQKQAAKEYFAGKRSSHWDEVAKLERQKADARNLSTDAIMSAGNEAVRRAQEQADEAVRAGAMTDGITYKPIKYEETKQKDWTYDPTKTEIKKPEEEQKDDNSLYNKYFRDKEEEKKKKGWISATVN